MFLEVRDHISDIADHADAVEKRLDDEVDMERLISCSRDFERECGEHGVPCYVIDGEFCVDDMLSRIMGMSDGPEGKPESGAGIDMTEER